MAVGISSSDNVLRILSGYNQWWQLYGVLPYFIKHTHRNIYHEVKRVMEKPTMRAIFVEGPHRTGKTATIHHLIQNMLDHGHNPKTIVYMNFGHPFFSFLSIDRIYGIFRDNVCPSITGKTYCFLDDTQLLPDWEKKVRSLKQMFPEVTIICFSSMRPLQLESDEVQLHLPPLSFYEYCQIALGEEEVLPNLFDYSSGILKTDTRQLKQISENLMKLRPYFRGYAHTGGFLNLVGETDEIRIQRMIQKTVVGDALLRDINMCFNVRNPLDLEKIFLYLCFECPKVISFESIMREIDCVSRPTIEKYVNFLAQASLIYQCFPQKTENDSCLKVQPKIYLTDAAINTSMMMSTGFQSTEENKRRNVETMVYRHLRFCGPDDEEGRITYDRERSSGKNIDLILDGRRRLYVDIRYEDNIRLSRKDAIIARHDEADLCLVITKNEDMMGYIPNLPQNVFFLPATIFLFLIGQAKHDNRSFLDGI